MRAFHTCIMNCSLLQVSFVFIQVSFDMLCVYPQNGVRAVIHVTLTCCTDIAAICALSTHEFGISLLYRSLLRIHRFLLICFANIRRMARVLQRRAVGTAAQRALICTCRGLATLWARAARVRAEISGVWRGFRAARAPRESRRGLGCESRCALLQRTAAQCITLQHTATGCNTLQHTATHCNTLQHTRRAKVEEDLVA